MASSAGGRPDDSGCDKVGKAVIWCIERREFGNRATPIRDDDLFAGLHTIDVLTQTVLEVPNPNF